MLPMTSVHGSIILLCQKVRHPCPRYVLPTCICLLATSPFLISPAFPSHPLLSSPFPLSLLFSDLYISFNAKPVIRQYKKILRKPNLQARGQAPENLLFVIKACLGICNGQHATHKEGSARKLQGGGLGFCCWKCM